MKTNKVNMPIETVAVLYIVSISDVSHPISCSFDLNEHIYFMWSQDSPIWNSSYILLARNVSKRKPSLG